MINRQKSGSIGVLGVQNILLVTIAFYFNILISLLLLTLSTDWSVCFGQVIGKLLVR